MITRIFLRYAGRILLLGIMLTLLCGFFSVRLYQRLSADLEKLLPADAPSSLDLKKVTRRLRSVDNLALLVTSRDAAASRRFVDDLARRLNRLPHDVVAGVEYRIDRELSYFRSRQALFIDLKDLIRIRDQIRARIQYERQLYNPLNIFSGQDIQVPRFNIPAVLKRYESSLADYERYPGGYYANPEQTKRVVLVALPGVADLSSATRLKAAVEGEVAALRPSDYAPDLTVLYSGNVQNTLEEHAALLQDVAISTIVVAFLVSAALLLYFKNVQATLALLASLLMGTLITFGICYFAVGELNANSGFLGSIVIGNGINCGIILLARYLEESRSGKTHLLALSSSIRNTWAATLTAALAAAASYGSLMLTSFRGFRQFGLIGLIGMIVCWLSAYSFLPAILTWLTRGDGKQRVPAQIQSPHQRHSVLSGFIEFTRRRARGIILAGTVATLASVFLAFRISPDILEADLSKLRSRASQERGSAFVSLSVDEVLRRYLTPVAILPETRQQARLISGRLKAIQREQGARSGFAAVSTIDDFIPRDQARKIGVIRQIRKLLRPRELSLLPPRLRAMAGTFLTDAATRPIRVKDLPPLLLSKFTEKDGSVGKVVLVEPPLDERIRDRDFLFSFVSRVRAVASEVAPGTPVAGTLPITVDLLSSIMRDGPRATLFAFLAVSLVVILVLRRLATTTLALGSLLIGVLWLLGALVLLRIRINFLNFVALPITFGIGADYGVNVYQRYQLEGRRAILKVIRETGSAVALCSLTTIIGYGSLLLAQNQALVSFGRLAILGEITCLAAAIGFIPAILLKRDGREQPAAVEAQSALNGKAA